MASAGTQAPESAGYTGTKIPEDRDVVPVSAKPKFWLFQPERHKDPFERKVDAFLSNDTSGPEGGAGRPSGLLGDFRYQGPGRPGVRGEIGVVAGTLFFGMGINRRDQQQVHKRVLRTDGFDSLFDSGDEVLVHQPIHPQQPGIRIHAADPAEERHGSGGEFLL